MRSFKGRFAHLEFGIDWHVVRKSIIGPWDGNIKLVRQSCKSKIKGVPADVSGSGNMLV